ncbi:kinase-like domain-containing protein [Fennellomyces sp. T-0311]|nr:kinase-like domain-containing protein [Fennellomyces sp. T-0311]
MLSPCITPPSSATLQEIVHTHTDVLLDCLVAVYTDLVGKNLSKEYEPLYRRVKQLRASKDDFEDIRPLACGQFAQVSVVRHKGDGQVYAMKKLNKAHVLSHRERTFSMEERWVLANHDNEWMPKLHWAFQDDDCLYLVMEYAGGGDLLSVLLKQDKHCLSENEARFYIAETIVAVDCLHQMGYIHRDIKPNNILIDHTGHVKIADFGSCISIADAKKMPPTVAVGTCDYVAPEVLQAQQGNITYGAEVDWWSVGIVLYEILQVNPPFYSESDTKTFLKILSHENSELQFDDEPISPECKDLICKLLCKRETRLGRNSVQEIQAHPFFAGIDWSNLRKTKPPFQPILTSPDDTSNFCDANEQMTTFSSWDISDEQRYLPFIGYSFAGTTQTAQNELQHLRKENERLLLQINHNEKKDIRSPQIDVLNKDNTRLKTVEHDIRRQLQQKTARLKEIEDENKRLQCGATEQSGELAKAQQQISQLLLETRKRDTLRNETTRLKAIEEENRRLQQESIERTNELDRAQKRIDHLLFERKDRDAQQRKVHELENQLQKLLRELQHSQQQIHQLQASSNQANQRIKEEQQLLLNDKDKQLWEYENEIQRLHDELQADRDAMDQIQMLYDENERLRADQEFAIAQAESLRNEFTKLKQTTEQQIQLLCNENARLKKAQQYAEERDIKERLGEKALPLLPMPIREGRLKISAHSKPFAEFDVKLEDGTLHATAHDRQKIILNLRDTILIQESQQDILGVPAQCVLVIRGPGHNHLLAKIDQQLAKEQQYIQGANKTLQARQKLLASSGVMVMSSTKQQRQIQLELEQAVATAQAKVAQLMSERQLLLKGNDMTEHDFKSQRAAGESKCGFCQDTLWGPRALACQNCQYQCHPQCPVDIGCDTYRQMMESSPYYLCLKDPADRKKWKRWLERSMMRYSEASREKALSR